MKIAGPKILHKTDVGGVKLNLADEAAVRTAYDEMIESVREQMGDDIEIWGVVIQKMLDPGKEVILGVTRDDRFGPGADVRLGRHLHRGVPGRRVPAGPDPRERGRRNDPRHPLDQAAAGRPRRSRRRT